jgi:sugar phosphate permease
MDDINGGYPTDTMRPTRVRHGILVMVILVAVLLYMHRYCLSTADRDIKEELGLTEDQMSKVLGAFFFSYALCQIPFGYLSDRYGARRMLTVYMVAWSTLTGFIGMARGYLDLLLFRLGSGMFEAGTYPACAGVVKRWIPYESRGLASGAVSLGGRLGGAITPKLTALLMVGFAAWYPLGSWRPAMVVYGVSGVAFAMLFWLLYRDSPEHHPGVNQLEADLITHGDPHPQRYDDAPPSVPWIGVLTNASLWMCSLVQFGINFGWVFLITYLNRYLQEVHDLPIETRGTMGSIVMAMSLPALLLGGWLTDRMTRALGRRWGRSLPMALPRFLSAGCFIAVLACDDPWVIIFLLGAVAFFSDLGVPAIWAFNMDVAGRNVGFILGWGNMWGNLGAAVSPLVLNEIVMYLRADGASFEAAWDAVFLICGIVFFLVGIACLGINATSRIANPTAEQRT